MQNNKNVQTRYGNPECIKENTFWHLLTYMRLLAPLLLSERISKRLGFRLVSLEPQIKASLGQFLLKTTAGTCKMY